MKKWCWRSLAIALVLFVLLIVLFARGAMLAWQETPLARIVVTVLSSEHAHLRLIDNNGFEFGGDIYGSHWQIDAFVLLWHDPLLKLGFKPVVRLSGVHGKYMGERESAQQSLLNGIELGAEVTFSQVLWEWLEQRSWVPGIRSVFGAAVFMPVREGRFELVLKGAGLVLVPLSEQ